MSYTNAFVQVATDCPVSVSEKPESKRDTIPQHLIQFELLTTYPYRFNHEELIYEVFIRHKGIKTMQAEEEQKVKADLFSKGHPCMRASALTKRYGFGAHYNELGKIAIFAVESDEYYKLSHDPAINQVPAMRSKKL